MSEGKDHSEDLSIDGKILLKLVLRKCSREYGLDLSGSAWEPVIWQYLANRALNIRVS
jgi:hypothetical protein